MFNPLSNLFFRRPTKREFGPVFFLTSSFILLFTYRLGSLRVDKGQVPGLRDIGTYFNGGLAIISGENPYENPYFRIGPTGGLLLGVLAKIAPDFLAATLIMALSIFGFAFFIGTFSGYQKLINFPWIFLGVVIFISAQRENLVNIQITGILALSLAYGFRLIEKDRKIIRLLGVVLIAISVETKPHVVGLFVLLLLIYGKKYRYLFSIGFTLLLFQALISLYVREFIILSWFKLVLNLGKEASVGQLPERIAFETPFELLGISSKVAIMIMGILFLGFSLASIVIAQKINTLHLGLTLPSLGIFFHYYDLALAFGLMLTILYSRRHYKLLFVIIGSYLLPQNFGSINNLILVTLLLMILSASIFWTRPVVAIMHSVLGMTSWLVYVFLVKIFNRQVDIHELSMSINIITSIVVGAHLVRQVRRDDLRLVH